jgi:hypothetical protein
MKTGSFIQAIEKQENVMGERWSWGSEPGVKADGRGQVLSRGAASFRFVLQVAAIAGSGTPEDDHCGRLRFDKDAVSSLFKHARQRPPFSAQEKEILGGDR